VLTQSFAGPVHGRLTRGSERIQTATRPVLAGRNLWILPAASKEAHRLEASEGSIERAVRRQQTSTRDIAKALGHFVPVKLLAAVLMKISRSGANG
jgi:hypothetical protein